MLSDRKRVALTALEKAGTGLPLALRDPRDPFGVVRKSIGALVKDGLLPDSSYGPTFKALYDGGLVDGYWCGQDGEWFNVMLWWITPAGRRKLADALAVPR